MTELRNRPWLAIWSLLALGLIALRFGVVEPRAATQASLADEHEQLSAALHAARQARAERQEEMRRSVDRAAWLAPRQQVIVDSAALTRQLVVAAARQDLRVVALTPLSESSDERTVRLELRASYAAVVSLLWSLADDGLPVRIHHVRLSRANRKASPQLATELDVEIVVEALAWPQVSS